MLEIIFERFIAKDQRLIVGHPITVEGQQVLELGRGNPGAQHANANQRPGIGLDEHLLRVGLNVVDSLLDGNVGPQTATLHVELVQAVEPALHARRRQVHARMPARDFHQTLRGELGVVLEVHRAHPGGGAGLDGEKYVAFQRRGVSLNAMGDLGLIVAIGCHQVAQTLLRGVEILGGKGLAQSQSRGGNERSGVQHPHTALHRYRPDEILGAGDEGYGHPRPVGSPVRAQFRKPPGSVKTL